MYNEVEDIHSNSEVYYFTDHSRRHSDRIAENLVHLFPFLFFGGDDNRELNDVEKFILFSSILLHDIRLKAVIKIAMPIIGCGLDKLSWNKVSDIIKDVFMNTNMEILVCKQ